MVEARVGQGLRIPIAVDGAELVRRKPLPAGITLEPGFISDTTSVLASTDVVSSRGRVTVCTCSRHPSETERHPMRETVAMSKGSMLFEKEIDRKLQPLSKYNDRRREALKYHAKAVRLVAAVLVEQAMRVQNKDASARLNIIFSTQALPASHIA